jgi:ketosteroid isomerase-like protein
VSATARFLFLSETIYQLTEIQHQLAAGFATGDPTTHQRVLDDDWTVIDPGANILTKQMVLGTAFSAERNFSTAKIDDIAIRDLGDFAVVTGRTTMIGTLGGQAIDIQLRFTDIFARRSDEWKCLASQGTQGTLIPPVTS